MATPRVMILRAPGTNCDVETAWAFEKAGGRPERVHINRLLESPAVMADYQVLCLPGGFSYGDDIAAGRILGSQLRHRLAAILAEFTGQDKLVLGICNGFQVLLQTGLLFDDRQQPLATLAANDRNRFEDRWTYLRVTGTRCAMLAGIEQMYLPIAHAEGKFLARCPETLERLEASGQLVLRYAAAENAPELAVGYPENPNGSAGSVAGVCDATGRIFGLMPHPERHLEPFHHPRWTREPQGAAGHGMKIFENAVGYFQ